MSRLNVNVSHIPPSQVAARFIQMGEVSTLGLDSVVQTRQAKEEKHQMTGYQARTEHNATHAKRMHEDSRSQRGKSIEARRPRTGIASHPKAEATKKTGINK